MTANIPATANLDSESREGLAKVLDVVVPGTASLPSGRAVRAHQELLDLVLSADHTLTECVRAAGTQASDTGTVTLDDLHAWLGDDLERVVFALTAAYYMSREVRTVLGYPGQERRPIAQATPDEVASDELVAPVVRRGPIYVEPGPGQ